MKQSTIVSYLNNKNQNQNSNFIEEYKYILYFDGCSKGNPGKAGIGAVIYAEDEEVWADCSYIGDKVTNNQAEYNALILGLNKAIQMNITTLLVRGDSLLVIKQLCGSYKVKSMELLLLYNKVNELTKQFNNIKFEHVYREYNKRADKLSNIALQNIY
jgi:ribonuclease HI